MKLTKSQLKQIIKEEFENINEIAGAERVGEGHAEEIRNRIITDLNGVTDLKVLRTIVSILDKARLSPQP